MMFHTDLYFESHITIEPVFGEKLEDLKEIVSQYSFKVAELLMSKRKEDTPERSRFDTFCTLRGSNWKEIEANTIKCVDLLTVSGFKVWRYKIENTLLDVRMR